MSTAGVGEFTTISIQWDSSSLSNLVKKTDYSFVWIYISPFILLVGSVGNALALCVMNRKAFKHSTTRIYLSAMAVGDTCALFWRIAPEFLRASKSFDFTSLSEWTCRLEHFSFYTSSDAAIWFMVSFTFDRLIAVCFPLHKKRICKKRKSRFVVLLVLTIAIIKNLHVFWTRGFNSMVTPNFNYSNTLTFTNVSFNSSSEIIKSAKYSCKRLKKYSFFEEIVRPWLAFTFVSLLPTFILIICNVLIVRTLLRVYKFRQATVENYSRENRASSYCQGSESHKNLVVQFALTSEMTSPDKSNQRKSSSDSAHRLSSSVTGKFAFTHASLMCISVSIMFLVSVAPSIILTIGRKTWEQYKHYDLAKAANNQLACLNHACNFFLYCLTGERFRCELLIMLRLRKRNDDSKYRLTTSPSFRTMELLANKKKQTTKSTPTKYT